MRSVALVIAVLVGLIAPVAAQRANIDAANAKWIELFNKGDFDGVASLYTTDATAFPPGSAMVKGRAAIGALWKSMAEQASDPKLTTIDVKRLGPTAARAETRNGDRMNIIRNRTWMRKDSPAHSVTLNWRKSILVACQFFAFSHSLDP